MIHRFHNTQVWRSSSALLSLLLTERGNFVCSPSNLTEIRVRHSSIVYFAYDTVEVLSIHDYLTFSF